MVNCVDSNHVAPDAPGLFVHTYTWRLGAYYPHSVCGRRSWLYRLGGRAGTSLARWVSYFPSWAAGDSDCWPSEGDPVGLAVDPRSGSNAQRRRAFERLGPYSYSPPLGPSRHDRKAALCNSFFLITTNNIKQKVKWLLSCLSN